MLYIRMWLERRTDLTPNVSSPPASTFSHYQEVCQSNYFPFNGIKKNKQMCGCCIKEGSALLCYLHPDSALLPVFLLLTATISSLICSTAGGNVSAGAGCLPHCCRWQCRVTGKKTRATGSCGAAGCLLAPADACGRPTKLQGILTITVCKDFWQCDPPLPPIQGPFVLSLHSLQETISSAGQRLENKLHI